MNRFNIRNDLAITLHKLNQKKKCLDILEPFSRAIEDAKTTRRAAEESIEHAEITELIGVQPTYYEEAEAALKAAKTNLKLCGWQPPKK